MKNIVAICQTDGCTHKGIKSEFVSDVLETLCGACNTIIEDITATEILDDGTSEEA